MWVTLYIVSLVLVALFAAYVNQTLGILVLSILPDVALLVFLHHRFKKAPFLLQGLTTFFEAVIWMCPLVVLENAWNFLFISWTKLPNKGGDCAKCILSSFVQVIMD